MADAPDIHEPKAAGPIRDLDRLIERWTAVGTQVEAAAGTLNEILILVLGFLRAKMEHRE